MRSDSPSISITSRHVSSITTVSPDKKHTNRKIKIDKISETLMKGKEII